MPSNIKLLHKTHGLHPLDRIPHVHNHIKMKHTKCSCPQYGGIIHHNHKQKLHQTRYGGSIWNDIPVIGTVVSNQQKRNASNYFNGLAKLKYQIDSSEEYPEYQDPHNTRNQEQLNTWKNTYNAGLAEANKAYSDYSKETGLEAYGNVPLNSSYLKQMDVYKKQGLNNMKRIIENQDGAVQDPDDYNSYLKKYGYKDIQQYSAADIAKQGVQLGLNI